MKMTSIYVFIFIILIFPATFIPVFAQFQNLEGIGIEAASINRVQSANSDVILLDLTFSNSGKSASTIWGSLIFLIDNTGREFLSASYLELKEKGHDVSSKDCPFVFTININPGTSTNQKFCFETPRDASGFSLTLYQTLPELCEEPLFDCEFKKYPIEISETGTKLTPTSKIPDWVRIIFVWYGEKAVSEDELLNAIRFLIKENILIL